MGLLEDSRLDFVDPKNKVNVLLNAFDIFVLTSRAEGIPTVILEAMATGLPVVSNDIGSVAEIVVNNHNGILVRKLDSGEIASAIQLLISDETLRYELGAASRDEVIKNFNIKKCAEIHIQAYQKASENRRN
jgi:glycosyltransferase involved in cell wall biosynthesis